MLNDQKTDIRELSGKAAKTLSGEAVQIRKEQKINELAQRIREISLEGRFTIDEEGWPDYTVLNSDDPFTNLFLDSESYSKYSDETVRNHYKEITKFLSSLLQNQNQGITFQDQYPDLNLELAQRKVNKAFDKLSSPDKRKSASDALVEIKKSEGKQLLDRFLDLILSDQRLTIEETKTFLNEAAKWKYSPSEAAEMLFKAISEKDYIAESHVDENSSAYDKLLSSDWASKDAVERNTVSFRLVFNDKVITNLKDLGRYFYDNKGLAIMLIQSRRVVESITPYYPLVAENCANIIRRYDDEEAQYLGIIYELNPNLPFRLLPDVEISSEQELMDRVFESKSNLLDVVLRSFNNNHLAIWWQLKNDKILELFNSTREEITPVNESFKSSSKQKNKALVPSVSREVFFAVLYKINPALPYFYSQELKFKNTKDFARWLVDNPDAGDEVQRQIKSGLVSAWLQYCAKETAEIQTHVSELKEDSKLNPGNFSQVLGYALDPKLKFLVNNSTGLDKIEDLEEIVKQNGRVWPDLERLLSNRTLTYWLKFRGEAKLLENYNAKCLSLASRGLLDNDTALNALIDVACPRRSFGFSITPGSVDLGKMASGSSKKLVFKVVKEGTGHLRGDLVFQLVSESKRALVNPEIIPTEIIIPVDATQKEFTVSISNNGELGSTVRYDINFHSNSKDSSVPVSYQSELPLGMLLLNGLGGALVLGLFFVLMRLLMNWVTGNFSITEFEEPSFGFKWITQIAAYEWKLFAGFVGVVIVAIATFLYVTFLAEE
ncbi:MAG: hypothetical protein HBSAPP04_00290 [Ignavibacteriaceae bacterium]|nr:MAG: hypothetical protein HBSAPP04_00290 [Ignavibacteriaceae bacterium]